MYPKPEFREHDRAAIVEFMKKHPLALVAAAGDAGIAASHVPVLIDDGGEQIKLRAHVMRKTQHWEAFKRAAELFVVFTGPDAPVLESWNSTRPFGGTWNYMAVHARGSARFLAEAELIELLRDLKNLHEVEPAAKFDNLPTEYITALIPAIEGFEITLNSVEAVFKLSQNRSREDFEHTIDALQRKGGESSLVAEEMVSRRASFFPE